MRMVKTIYLTCLEMKNFDIQRADEIFMGSNSWSQVYKMASTQNEIRHEGRKYTITEDLRLPELYNWRYYISLTYIDRFGTMRGNITSSKLNFELNSTHWKSVSFKRFKNENMHEFAYFVLDMITQRMYACYFEMIVQLHVLYIYNYVN